MNGHFDEESAHSALSIAESLRVEVAAIERLRMRLHIESGEARGLSGVDLYASHEGTYDSRALRIASDHVAAAVRMLREIAGRDE